MAALQKILGSTIRGAGKVFDTVGKQLEVHGYTEKLQPSLLSVKVKGTAPKISNVRFIANNSAVVGNVSVNSQSALWYNSIVKSGKNQSVNIGERTSVGEHANLISSRISLKVGNNVFIGSNATLIDCTVKDGAVIESSATVHASATIGDNAIIGAGSVVAPGTSIPANQFWQGNPAAFVRHVSDVEQRHYVSVLNEELELAVVHAAESAKSWQQIEVDEYEYEQVHDRSTEYYRRLSPQEMSERHGEVEGNEAPGRLFDSKISAPKVN